MANVPEVPPLIHLHTLDITRESDLEKLTLPTLIDLCISEPCFTSSPAGPVKIFLSRSGCHLPWLRIAITEAQRPRSHYRRAWPSVGKLVVRQPEPDDSDSAGELGTLHSEDDSSGDEDDTSSEV
ncbi:hypothetical protein C8R44DRAFT_873512 [Mycena epipterygia]|nr:hypothetical protein C8R44DRAFT_873512 [Mycena epipterygia]